MPGIRLHSLWDSLHAVHLSGLVLVLLLLLVLISQEAVQAVVFLPTVVLEVAT